MSKKKSGEERKRFAVRLLAIVLCLLLAGSAVFAGLFSLLAYAQEEEGVGSTAIELRVDELSQGARVKQATTYVNHTGRALDHVLFALHANTLRRMSTAPFEPSELTDAYPAGFTPGGVEFYSVQVNGQNARWAVRGDAESFVRVDCALEPGESAEFSFQYDLVLPTAGGFLGAGEMGWRLSFFYPAPVVYDQALEQFAAIELSAVGDALYFDAQDITLTVDAPSTYQVASGGEDSAQTLQGGRTLTTVRLPRARDAALALSRRYTAHERDAACGTRLTVYANAGSGAGRALDAAENAVNLYADKLGAPLERLTIAQVDGPGSSAHSGILLLEEALFSDGAALEREIAFLTAKQYFGLWVGSNPSLEPWLSDALSRYVMLLYYEEVYGRDRFLKELNENSLDALNQTLPGGLTVDSHLIQFHSVSEYETVIWGRGAAVCHELRAALGLAPFWRALSLYRERNAGRMASIADFAAALNEASGRALDDLLVSTLQNIGDYVDAGLTWYE